MLLLLAGVLGCDVVTGPGYLDDFTDAFCGYQARCGDRVSLDSCEADQALTFDECAEYVARNHALLEGCAWNAEHAQACIEAYQALQVCPGEGAGQPEACALVYSGGPACAAFPYPVCEAGDSGDTGGT